MVFLIYINGIMIWYFSVGIINFFDVLYNNKKRDKIYFGYLLLIIINFIKN